MLKILNQDKTEVFDVERTNIFVCGNKILISDKVNIYEGKAACLGIYNDGQEAKDVFFKILSTFTVIYNAEKGFYCAQMPEKENREGKEETNGGEQGKARENDKV
jgi:hypothetical protein